MGERCSLWSFFPRSWRVREYIWFFHERENVIIVFWGYLEVILLRGEICPDVMSPVFRYWKEIFKCDGPRYSLKIKKKGLYENFCFKTRMYTFKLKNSYSLYTILHKKSFKDFLKGIILKTYVCKHSFIQFFPINYFIDLPLESSHLIRLLE